MAIKCWSILVTNLSVFVDPSIFSSRECLLCVLNIFINNNLYRTDTKTFWKFATLRTSWAEIPRRARVHLQLPKILHDIAFGELRTS